MRKRSSLNTAAVAGGVLSAALILAACGGGGGGDSSRTEGAAPEVEAPAAETPAAAPAAAVPEAAPAAPAATIEAAPAAPAAAAPTAPSAPKPVAAAAPKAPKAAAKAPASEGPKTPGAIPSAQAPAPAPGAAPVDASATGTGDAAPAAQGNPNSDIGVSATEIKFGSINFVNYPMGNLFATAQIRAQDGAFAAINDTGGLYGRKLKQISCDDSGDITRTRACYKKLVHEDKIFAFTTMITWGAGELHADLARDKVPWFASFGFFTSEWRDPWMFPAHMASVHEAHANAQWVLDVVKPKSVGILKWNTPETHLASKAIRQVLEPAGVKIAKDIAVEVSTPDESAHVIEMRSADVDHIMHYAYPPPIVKFMIDAAQQNYWPPKGMSGNHMASETLGPLMGEWPVRGYWTNTTYNLWGSEYIAAMNKYAPSMKGNSHHITQAGWVGVKIFAQCNKEIGPNLTRLAMMKCFESRYWDAGPGMDQKMFWSPASAENPAAHDTTGDHANRCEWLLKFESTETGAYGEASTDKGFVKPLKICDKYD